MPVKKKGLGKGINSLIPKSDMIPEGPVSDGGSLSVPISKVEPDREQPRKTFDDEKMKELTDSVKEHGIIIPLLVQDKGDYYEIVAGERRWRAAMAAGLKEVPVIIKDYSQKEKYEVSLIENVIRDDLNDIEEAMAYKHLMDDFDMTQDDVAKRVGKNRSTIANSVRLLNLEKEIQDMLIVGSLTSGHARALLTISNPEKRLEIARRVSEEGLTVRNIEQLVKNPDKPVKKKDSAMPKGTPVLDLVYREFEHNLTEKLSAKVSIVPKTDAKGKIEIDYFSKDELDQLLELLSTVQVDR